MPFINLKTNVPINEEKITLLKTKFGQVVSALLEKSENWLMINFEDNCKMYFKGTSSLPVAFIEVSVFGKSDESSYNRLTIEITNALKRELEIEPSQIYIKYVETEYWGWNGNNF